MIAPETIVIWLVVLNALAAALFCWILQKVPASGSRRSFLGFLFGYCLWINPLLLIQLVGAQHWASDFVARSILAGGCIFVATLGHFTLSFAAAEEVQTLRYRAFVANFAFLFLAAYAGWIEAGVSRTEVGLAPIPGPLQPYFNFSMVAYGLYFLSYATLAYRRSEDSFLRLQLRTILYTCVPAFMLGLLTNAIIPGVTGNFQLTPTGGLWLLLFFGGVTYILVTGRMLLVRDNLRSAMRSPQFSKPENLLSLQKLVSYLHYRLDEPADSFRNEFGFTKANGEALEFVVERKPLHKEAMPTPLGSRVLMAHASGTAAAKVARISDLDRYASENKELALLAGAAQQRLIEARERMAAMSALPPAAHQERTLVEWKKQKAEIEKNARAQFELFGLSESCFSSRKAAFLQSLSAARVASNILLLEGECGTGKTHYARLAHRSRAGSSLRNFRCVKANSSTWLEEVKDFLDNPAVALDIGLLLTHVDKLRLEHLELLTAVFRLSFSYERFAYLTVAPGFLENTTEAPFNIIQLYTNARVVVPPLAEMTEDIPYLMGILGARSASVLGTEFVGISPAAIEAGQRYSWPGNVVELEQAVLLGLLESQNGVLEDLPIFTVPGMPLPEDAMKREIKIATHYQSQQE